MKGFEIIESDQPLNVGSLFTVLYGLPGVGKTSTAFTMPGNCLLIDADTGMHRAIPKLRPKTVRITQYGAFWAFVQSQAFADYIATNGIKSVIIDTVGTLLEDKIGPWLISQDPKNGNYMGGLSLPGWGSLKNNFNALKARFQNLGLFVCCICHAREEGEGPNRRFELAVSGGSADIIYRSADLIGFMTITGDKRQVSFSPSNVSIGKNIGNIPAQIVPDAGTPEYDSFFAGVIGEAMNNISAGSQSLAEFQKALDEWQSQIDQANDAESFERLINQGKEIPGKAMQMQFKTRLFTAMDSKGFKFDPSTKKVVAK
jgi:hypothetical protein